MKEVGVSDRRHPGDLLFSPGQQYPSGSDSLCQYRSIACTEEQHGERR